MLRLGVACLLIFPFQQFALGQWTVGPRADLALFKAMPRYIAYGIGASTTYSPRNRNCWVADVAYHVPHIDHFVHVQGPRNLATGDTTSSTWHGTLHESHTSLIFGFQRTFNRRPKPMEWYWRAASGLEMARHRNEGEVAYKYSGEQRLFDHSSNTVNIPAVVGSGRTWHLKDADLALDLSAMLPLYSVTTGEFAIEPRAFSLFLAFHYRWRL